MVVARWNKMRDNLHQLPLDLWEPWIPWSIFSLRGATSWRVQEIQNEQSKKIESSQDFQLIELDFWHQWSKFYQCKYNKETWKIASVLLFHKNTYYKINLQQYSISSLKNINRWWEDKEDIYSIWINISEWMYSWQLWDYHKAYWPENSLEHKNFLHLLKVFLCDFHSQSKYLQQIH
jgi:hypothetical protein